MKLYFIAVFTAFCLLMPASSGLAREQTTVATNSGIHENRIKATKAKQSKEQKKTEAEPSYNFQPIVVTGTKTQVPLSQSTKDINIVTNQKMQTFQQVTIPNVLNTVPGVMEQDQGGPGQYSPINIRGAGSEYVQFQYDGFPLKDAADTQTSFQYLGGDLLGLSGINRIEVLNGTNSVLYGSAAMGGVVNIIPQKWGYGFTGELMGEAASDNTYVTNAGISYGNDKYYLNLNPTYITTDGITNGGPNGYYYHNFAFNGSAGVKLGDNMSLQLFNLYSTSDMALTAASWHFAELNAQNRLIPNFASPTDHQEAMFTLTGVAFDQVVSPIWNYSLKYAYGRTQRDLYEPQGNYGDTTGMDFDGSTNWLEMQHNVRVAHWLTLSGGFDFERDSYSNVLPVIAYAPITYTPNWTGQNLSTSKSWYGYDFYGLGQTAFFDKSLLINAGLRFYDHQNFPSKVVGEVSAAYIFKQTGTKIHSAFGTGYRTPSLYEIYGGYASPSGQMITVGNTNLRPEKDTSYDVGITQPLFGNKINCDLTWFYMDFNNIIYYDFFSSKYQNGADGRTTGIEAKLEAQPCKYFNLTASYTYAFAQYKNNSTGPWLRQNYWPMDTVALIGTVRPTSKLRISLKMLWEGDRIIPLYNELGNEVYYHESSDVRCDLMANYRILQNCEGFRSVDMFLKVTNLFNEHYTESGYQMPGQWFWGGVKLVY